MVHMVLPFDDERRLSYYLAMEEYVARTMDDDDAFFTWSVPPSVIIGRNQLVANEVDQDYCRRQGVALYRRKSGGGCVYADRGNLMLSYVTSGSHVGLAYNKYVQYIKMALRSMGILVEVTGRNDLLLSGGKVSGTAFFRLGSRCIVHGTLLYDTDMENMTCCLTPDGEKLESHGVRSVKSRISLLKDFTSLSLDDINRGMTAFLCNQEHIMTAGECRSIEEIEKEYLDAGFIYGKDPRYTVKKQRRIDGVGTVMVMMSLKNGIVKGMELKGDFFALADTDALICRPLVGKRLDADTLSSVLPDHLESIVRNLSKQEFLNLIID